MSDLDKIIITSLTTIIGGISILVWGQIIIKFFIEPYQEYRKLLAEIVDNITFFANVDAQLMDQKDVDEAKKSLRQRASQLRAKTYTIPLYGLFIRLKLLPSRENIEKAAGCLIGMSNMLYDKTTRASLDRDKLGVETSEYLGIRHYKSKP